jgi:hypothetical protein
MFNATQEGHTMKIPFITRTTRRPRISESDWALIEEAHLKLQLDPADESDAKWFRACARNHYRSVFGYGPFDFVEEAYSIPAYVAFARHVLAG